jgi:hypothetical protein
VGRPDERVTNISLIGIELHFVHCFTKFMHSLTVFRMKKVQGIAKIAVLLFSMTLAGCFVAYRAGALQGSKDGGADNSAIMPSSKSMALPPSDIAPAAAPPTDEQLMGSSKSGKVFTVDSPRKALPVQPSDTWMGSSKNDGIFEPNPKNPESIPNNNQSLQEQTRPVIHKEPEGFIGSSKSGEIFRPKANEAAPAKADTVKLRTLPSDDDDFMGSSKSAPIFRPRPDTNKPKNVPNNPPK